MASQLSIAAGEGKQLFPQGSHWLSRANENKHYMMALSGANIQQQWQYTATMQLYSQKERRVSQRLGTCQTYIWIANVRTRSTCSYIVLGTQLQNQTLNGARQTVYSYTIVLFFCLVLELLLLLYCLMVKKCCFVNGSSGMKKRRTYSATISGK